MADKGRTAGIYFSGTGNTKYCVETFMRVWDKDSLCCPLENSAAGRAVAECDSLVLGYPVYYSNLPAIVRDFIKQNTSAFRGKKVFLIATMGLFSGDGTGYAARILKEHGADIAGGLHVKMPDCIGDEKVLKRPMERNRKIVRAAAEKIHEAAEKYKNGNPPREGLGFMAHAAGLLGQRLWFYNKTKGYSDKLRIHADKCIGCGICAKVCPMKNLIVADGKASTKNRCTLCYRCFSDCPQQAITILGNTVYEQCKLQRYI